MTQERLHDWPHHHQGGMQPTTVFAVYVTVKGTHDAMRPVPKRSHYVLKTGLANPQTSNGGTKIRWGLLECVCPVSSISR